MIAKNRHPAQSSAMRILAATALGLLPFIAFPAAASASASGWQDTQGGRVRLVTSGTPDAKGVLNGILEIDLLPGWKTYWRDPGDAGVPPQIDISKSANIASVEMRFPAPERFDDGYSKWAGYKHSVALPVTFTLKSPGEAANIEADIFLGICETICIPVQGRLVLDPASDPDNPGDAAAIAAALEALPEPERPDFGVTVLEGDDKTLLVGANLIGNPATAEFFLAGDHGYMFGTPKRADSDGRVIFSVPILDRPANPPKEGVLHYTLVTGAGAVDGALPFP